LLKLYADKATTQFSRRAIANLKARLRMVTLYHFANEMNYMVAGSGNRDELTVGYFTKYGDGGVDILPIGNLLKSQVRELAQYLGIPQPIIDKPPSAGLWPGQTDEGEMGITYEELDCFLMTGKATNKTKQKIEILASCSEHKRHLPPVPPF
jgi:NAD+ synthase